jgi:hypothetical protein
MHAATTTNRFAKRQGFALQAILVARLNVC